MIVRWLPHPALTVVLTVVWVVINDSAAPGVILLGLLLGLLIPVLAAPLFASKRRRIRWRPLLGLLAVFIGDLIVANIRVVRIVLAPRLRAEPQFIAVPLDLSDRFGAAVLASIVTMTPGTVSVKVAMDERRLWIHALDVDDRDAVITHIKERYERPLRELFE